MGCGHFETLSLEPVEIGRFTPTESVVVAHRDFRIYYSTL